MSRYIDADLLKTDYYALPKSLSSLTVSTQYVSLSQILNTPTADVVEVVRCKDCQYFDQAEKYCCDFLTTEEDGFCKWGKRREE